MVKAQERAVEVAAGDVGGCSIRAIASGEPRTPPTDEIGAAASSLLVNGAIARGGRRWAC